MSVVCGPLCRCLCLCFVCCFTGERWQGGPKLCRPTGRSRATKIWTPKISDCVDLLCLLTKNWARFIGFNGDPSGERPKIFSFEWLRKRINTCAGKARGFKAHPRYKRLCVLSSVTRRQQNKHFYEFFLKWFSLSWSEGSERMTTAHFWSQNTILVAYRDSTNSRKSESRKPACVVYMCTFYIMTTTKKETTYRTKRRRRSQDVK